MLLKKIKSKVNSFLKIFGYKISKVNRNISIAEESDFEAKTRKEVKKYTEAGDFSIFNFFRACKYLFDNNIEGDFVEAGVYQGGMLILFAKILEKNPHESSRLIYGYDTFSGMTEPSEFDVKYKHKNEFNYTAERIINEKIKNNTLDQWVNCSLENVKKNLVLNLKSLKNIKLVVGDVRKTLLDINNIPEKISLLRIDTDFFDSTKVVLEKMYSKVEIGGVIILDDYGSWSGSKRAADDFFKEKNLKPFLFVSNESERIFIKTTN